MIRVLILLLWLASLTNLSVPEVVAKEAWTTTR
jgi:hypothetical protein